MENKIRKTLSFGKYCPAFVVQALLNGIFCIFIQLLCNDSILQTMNAVDYTLPVWFSALCVVTTVFLLMYQYYLASYIFDEQIKSCGILCSIGKSRTIVRKILLKKWFSVSLCTLIAGILIGTIIYLLCLFLFFETKTAVVPVVSIFGTVLSFVSLFILYSIHILQKIRSIQKMEIVEMLLWERKEKPVIYPRLHFFTGLLSLGAGVYFLKIYRSASYGFVNAFVPMICFVLSSHLLILSFSDWYERIYALSPSRYQRNLFYIAQLRTDYKKYTKMLTACTIIILFGLYMLIMNLSNIQISDNYDQENPYDFVLSIDHTRKKNLDVLKKFENNFHTSIEKSALVKLQKAFISWDTESYDLSVDLVPESSYTALSDIKLGLSGKQTVILTQLNRQYYTMDIQQTDGVEWGFRAPGSSFAIVEGRKYSFDITKELWQEVYNTDWQDKRTYIISDDYYTEILKDNNKHSGKYFLKLSENISEKTFEQIYAELKQVDAHPLVKSEVLAANQEKKQALFLLMLLPILLLLIALSGLIVLRIQQNFTKKRSVYQNLLDLGYTNQQVLTEFKKETATLFFLPLITGCTFSILYTLLSIDLIRIELYFLIAATVLVFSLAEYLFYRLVISSAKNRLFEGIFKNHYKKE